MLYLLTFILNTDNTICSVLSDTWYQIVWHLIADVGPHTYAMLWGVVTNNESLCTSYPPWEDVGHVQWTPLPWKGLFKLEVRGAEQDLIPLWDI